jgi:SAM-dependent methyltransferase
MPSGQYPITGRQSSISRAGRTISSAAGCSGNLDGADCYLLEWRMDSEYYRKHWASPERIRRMADPKRFEEIPPSRILAAVGTIHPGIVVDVGAGAGLYSTAFLDFPGVERVYACDISQAAVHYLQHEVAPAYPAVYPLHMEPLVIPLEDEAAGLVCFLNLHHEISDPPAMLRDAFRILAPGGKICIIDWKRSAPSVSGPTPAHRFTGDEVVRQVSEAGFTQVRDAGGLAYHFLVTGIKPAAAADVKKKFVRE